MATAVPVDPIAGFRFGIEIKGIMVGWFTECSGLTIERTVFPYEEGGVNEYIHQLPGPIKRTNVTLKHGISDSALWDWFHVGTRDGNVSRSNASIVLYNADRTEASRWSLTNVYPVKWIGPGLQIGESQVAVETIELAQGVGAGGAATGESVGAVQTQAENDGLQSVTNGEEQPDQAGDGPALVALAAKVYDLLKQELLLERERSGRMW